MAVDWLIIGPAALAVTTVLYLDRSSYAWVANRWLMAATFCADVNFAGLIFGLYEPRTLLARSRILLRSVLALSVGLVMGFACLSLFFRSPASRWVTLGAAVAYLLLAVPVRLLAHQVITTSRMRLLCVGAGESIRKLVETLGHARRQQYEVVGHVRVTDGAGQPRATKVRLQPEPRFRTQADSNFESVCPCLGTVEEIAGLVDAYRVDEIVVGSELASNPRVGQAVAVCLESRCRATDPATFVEKLLGEVPLESVSADWLLRADIQNRGNYEAVSTLMNRSAAATGLLLTIPAWPLIMLLIKLDSRGPALYRQVRLGRHGRCFTMYKFRTMRVDAEKDGARWAKQNDDRVTRVGRWLRRTRLDELPQLLNILRGDMSLVGPRPERPEFAHRLEQLVPHYRLRYLVKPGLTGWAQIHYGYGGSVADAYRKLCYDLYYLKHRSVELDLVILIRTLGTFLLGAH